MSKSYSYNYENVELYRKLLCDEWSKIKWEWFVSNELPPYSSSFLLEYVEKILKKWRVSLSTKNHITISYVGLMVTSKITGNHIHLLMFGRNKDGQTLLDMDEREWEREWNDLTHKGSHIERVRDTGVIDYMTNEKNTPPGHFELIIPYNKKYLEKYRCSN